MASWEILKKARGKMVISQSSRKFLKFPRWPCDEYIWTKVYKIRQVATFGYCRKISLLWLIQRKIQEKKKKKSLEKWRRGHVAILYSKGASIYIEKDGLFFIINLERKKEQKKKKMKREYSSFGHGKKKIEPWRLMEKNHFLLVFLQIWRLSLTWKSCWSKKPPLCCKFMIIIKGEVEGKR